MIPVMTHGHGQGSGSVLGTWTSESMRDQGGEASFTANLHCDAGGAQQRIGLYFRTSSKSTDFGIRSVGIARRGREAPTVFAREPSDKRPKRSKTVKKPLCASVHSQTDREAGQQGPKSTDGPIERKNSNALVRTHAVVRRLTLSLEVVSD